jgi:tetratricopeptide (TPR) repeat protein
MKYVFYSLFAMLLLFSSCSIQRKNVKTNDKQNPTGEVNLTEEKKIEFEYLLVEGLKQKVVGDLEAAKKYFNGCLEINPNSASVMYELANIYAMRGDILVAKSLLEKAIAINPSNKWYKLLLAQIYQREKNYIGASAVYKELIKESPTTLDYYYMNAFLLTSAEKFDEAIKAYNDLEKQIGYNDQIAIARQQIYRQAGKNKQAYAELNRLIASNPNVPEYYGILADMYKEDGNMKMALEYYNKVIEADPTNGFVQFSLATYYAEMKNLKKAFEHAQQGFLNPDTDIETKIHLYLMLVSAPSENKLDSTQMDELTSDLCNVHPDDHRSYGIRADYLMQSGRKQEARDILKLAVEKDPNNYPVWEQLILLDNELGDHDVMIADCEKAIELFPSQPLIYVLKAVAHLQKKEYQKTIDALESGQVYVVDNKKMEVQFELYKAEALYNLNQKQKAFESFEKVIAIDPVNYMAMNNYAYYLSLLGEKLERAEALSGAVVQANPDNATYLDTHAWVLFKKKEYRLAKFYMENAIKNGGDENDVVIEHYGDILFMLNDVEGALKYWKKAVEMGNESKTLQKKIEEKRFIEGEE